MKVKVFHIRLTKENQEGDEREMNMFIEKVSVKKTFTEMVLGQVNFWSVLIFYDNDVVVWKPKLNSGKVFFGVDTELTEQEKEAFLVLKKWRADKAAELGLPVYMICNNAELLTVAKVRPLTKEGLLEIKGFAEYKVSKFGEDIIAVLNSI